MTTLLSAAQIRAARGMLGISRPELAKRAGISLPTLIAIEAESSREPKISSLRAVETALLASGAVFSRADGSVNVRLVAGPTGKLSGAETMEAAEMILAAGRKARTERGGLG
jgi:transcriptional regulator with XRE-family HTH domain